MDEYPGERVLIGEDENVAFHGAGDDELHMVFNFPLMRAKRLAAPQDLQAQRLAELPPGAWPCNTLGHHDAPRVWSRYGDGAHNAELARLRALALLLTLKGTPFLFNGEEIGMADLELSDLAHFRDTSALGQYHMLTRRLGDAARAGAGKGGGQHGDRCRSPMQLGDAPNAGFGPPGVAPWLPVNPNYRAGVNVAAQLGRPRLAAELLPAPAGAAPRDPGADRRRLPGPARSGRGLLAFLRQGAGGAPSCLVALNFSSAPQRLQPGAGRRAAGACCSRATPATPGPLALDQLGLAPFEVLIAELG